MGEGASFWVRRRSAMFAVLDDQGAELAGCARGAGWVFLRLAFADALFYENNRPSFDRGQSRDTLLPPLDLEALLPVLHGDQPLVIQAYRESDIRQVIALKNEFDLNVI